MKEIIEKYYRQEHSALSEEDIEEQNCIHTPDEIIEFALSVVKNCSIPHVVGQSEQLKSFLQEIAEDKSYIHSQYYKNKAKTLMERL